MPQPRHDRLNVVHGDRVHAREGLVEQHELGLGDEGPRDLEPAALAPRELEALLAPQVLDGQLVEQPLQPLRLLRDRKSTRLNSSHTVISYAVFCLKKKKKNQLK